MNGVEIVERGKQKDHEMIRSNQSMIWLVILLSDCGNNVKSYTAQGPKSAHSIEKLTTHIKSLDKDSNQRDRSST